MSSWNPREAMTLTSFLKFKMGRWAKTDSLPHWVMNNKPTHTEGQTLSYDSDRVYHEREIWIGENLMYMMKWEPVAQKELELVGMYAKIK